MNAQSVIDSYINNIAARLPQRVRNDVGLELRTLLIEELKATAAAEARAPDDALALQVVRRFGRPEDVAARYYQHGFQIIEPEHAPVFLMLSICSVAIQWALTLPGVFMARTAVGEWWWRWGFTALAWVGALVVWFGLATWVRRRWPVDSESLSRPWMHFLFWLPVRSDWRPDRETFERRAEKHAFPLGIVVTLFFIAPSWFVGLFTSDANASWAAYDADFRRWLLPPLIALMVVRLGAFAATMMSEGWRARLETFRHALWIGFIALLYWTLFRWDIFANPITDALFKTWLVFYVLVNTIQIVVWIRRTVTRVRVPKSLT